MINELIKLATHLDKKGRIKEADYLDHIIKSADEPSAEPSARAPAWAVWAAGLRGHAGDNSHRVNKLSGWHDWLRRLQAIYRDETRDRKSSNFVTYTAGMAPNTAKFKEAMNEIINSATWLRDNAPEDG